MFRYSAVSSDEEPLSRGWFVVPGVSLRSPMKILSSWRTRHKEFHWPHLHKNCFPVRRASPNSAHHDGGSERHHQEAGRQRSACDPRRNCGCHPVHQQQESFVLQSVWKMYVNALGCIVLNKWNNNEMKVLGSIYIQVSFLHHPFYRWLCVQISASSHVSIFITL